VRHGAVFHAAPASKPPQQQQQPCSILCWARRQLGGQNEGAVLHAAPASKLQQQQQHPWAGRHLGEQNDWGGLRPSLDDWNRTDARRPTQGSAYANSDGPDSEDEPGPPFSAYSTEATSVGLPGGTYYHEGVLCM
jgi:hypothetical protein